MRLLIVTQKVDSQDSVLGFFHSWLIEIARRVDRLTVICLYEGEHQLPKNVRVLSLGKEKGVSRGKYVYRFFVYMWRERKNYDKVFVHMNPIYVFLGGWLWRLLGKKIALWYVHGSADLKLKYAFWFVDRIYTAVPESFPFKGEKIAYVGHGIDTQAYNQPRPPRTDGQVRFLHVGRLSPSKHIKEIVDGFACIAKVVPNATLTLAGKTFSSEDDVYVTSIKNTIHSLRLDDRVSFIGAVPNPDMPALYRRFDYLLHLSSTGGLDKVVIESWCSGTPAFTDQKGFEGYLGVYKDRFMFASQDPEHMALLVQDMLESSDREDVARFIHDYMVKTFDIPELVDRVMKDYA